MSPRTKKQYEEIRHEKRELILETALEVFALHSYNGTSISMIAQHAGIAKGLLYNYFKSKEDLLRAIINKGLNDALGIYAPLLENKISDKDFTPKMFRNLFKKLFQSMRENAHFWRLYFSIAMQPGVLEMIVKDYEDMMFTHLDLLERYYKKQGSRKPRADALHAYILLDGITMNYIQPHKEFSLDELENIVIKGLEKPIY
jgi:AcrR family transcriptional regulator